mmetsp:Transcript_45536/g.73219  ORF Transcript_45536/g.73219 Transcript_45536/m.73219 type:complete len:213 (+) Transcript_45536:394-1032(+)
MQGNWRMSLIEAPEPLSKQKIKMKFDRVSISGKTLTCCNSTSGLRGVPEIITFMRAKDGTLFVDKHGSYIVKWRPEDNYIVINNAMGFCVKYTRISKSHHAQTRSWRVSGSRLEALQSRMRSNISVCAATGLQPCPEGDEGKARSAITENASTSFEKLAIEDVKVISRAEKTSPPLNKHSSNYCKNHTNNPLVITSDSENNVNIRLSIPEPH